MEKIYRIKKEAMPFYPKNLATKVYRIETWLSQGVFEEALEEVEPVYVEYGIKKSECSSDLSGWKDGTTKIHLSISVNDVSYRDHDALTDDVSVRLLMNEVQKTVNNHLRRINQ